MRIEILWHIQLSQEFPFLDYRLLEFSVSIPTEQKIHGALTKIILREAMKDYLPKEIYNRTDKIGFSTPIEQKLFNHKGELYNYCLDSIKNSDFTQDGFNRTKIKLILKIFLEYIVWLSF